MTAEHDSLRKRIDARNRFLAACSLAGAATTAYRSPNGKTDDQTYWIDIARLGSPDAPNVLVLACGMNGVEGYCGSTIMTEWLATGHQRDVPRDVGLIMFHTVLPAAFAAGSAAAPEKMPQGSWTDSVLSAAARRFANYAEMTGLKAANDPKAEERAIPDRAWMEAACDIVVDEVVEHARNVALIEFHTSLRPYGEVVAASCHPADSTASGRVEAWFGDDAIVGDPAILDMFALGFGQRLADLTLTAIHVEFGVYSMSGVLNLEARRTTQQRRADARALFAPDNEAWREHIGEAGTRIVGNALTGLASM